MFYNLCYNSWEYQWHYKMYIKTSIVFFENLFVSFFTSIIFWNWRNLNFSKNGGFFEKFLSPWKINRQEKGEKDRNVLLFAEEIWIDPMIEQKGMIFDHDFYHFFSFSSFPLFLGGKIKGERITTVVFKSHVFLLDPTLFAIFHRRNMPLKTLNLYILFKILSYSTRSHNIFDIKDIC